jgi:hypothetical protein
MVSLFIHLLVTANHAPNEWNGITVNRGQVATSRQHLSVLTGISEQSLRSCLSRLKSTSEITIKSTNKYSIITLCNYDKYQTSKIEINQQINQLTNKQSTSNQPATNHKQEVKKERKKEINLSAFQNFWNLYPKKRAREDAVKAWAKISPENGLVEKILSSVRVQMDTDDWRKENGKYIPLPATWLNGRRWEDEIGSRSKGLISSGDDFDLNAFYEEMSK